MGQVCKHSEKPRVLQQEVALRGFGGAAWYLLCHPLRTEALPFPWVSLFLLSRKLLSASVDRDELQQPPQCFCTRELWGLRGPKLAAGLWLDGWGAGRAGPRNGEGKGIRGIPGSWQQARRQLITVGQQGLTY